MSISQPSATCVSGSWEGRGKDCGNRTGQQVVGLRWQLGRRPKKENDIAQRSIYVRVTFTLRDSLGHVSWHVEEFDEASFRRLVAAFRGAARAMVM